MKKIISSESCRQGSLFVCMAAAGLLLAPFSGHAQPSFNKTDAFLNANKNWVFGVSAGLSFRSGTAVPVETSVTGTEGYAAMSDTATGDLLFYTNGASVWNAAHQVMPNGTGLRGNSFNNISSAHQGAVIVPVIGEKDRYYIFSLAHEGKVFPDPNKGSLFYTVVDMTLDGGKGDVDHSRKNISLDSNSLSEAMVAIPGCDNDIWLVVHSYSQIGTDYFYKSYHITAAGVNHIPVISPGRLKVYNSFLAVSPDRRRIALSVSFPTSPVKRELGRFDPATGEISDLIVLSSEGMGSWGGAFSPDNSKLYFIEMAAFTGPCNLLQYDISSWDSTGIEATKHAIVIPSGSLGVMRLYNDTIYAVDLNNNTKIHRINQPDSAGNACDFEFGAITLLPSTGQAQGAVSLGSQSVLPVPADTLRNFRDTLLCNGLDSGFLLEAVNGDPSFSYIWSTGETTASIEVTDGGGYSVFYTDGCARYTDTFSVRVSEPITISIDAKDSVIYAVGGPYDAYQWYKDDVLQQGAVSDSFHVTENAAYSVEVTNADGCSLRSAIYRVNNLSIASGAGLRMVSIYPNPARDVIHIQAAAAVTASLKDLAGRELIRTEQARAIQIGALPEGVYLLEVRDASGGGLIKTERIVKY